MIRELVRSNVTDKHTYRVLAEFKIERSQEHRVQGEPSDEPAHTSTRTVERGDTITTVERQSAQQSSGGEAENEALNDVIVSDKRVKP